MSEFKRYWNYEGPVVAFGKIAANRWHGKTIAVSKKKAISNLTYQFKKEAGLLPGARIALMESYLKEGDITT